jgi:hypothetical protein
MGRPSFRADARAHQLITQRPLRFLISSFLLCLGHAAAIAAPASLTCGDYMDDRAALELAPMGAKRLNAHVLTVNYQGGVKRFVDQPPYQEAFAGAHWYYCGYLPELRAHLIGKNEEDLFSGVLLLDDTGQLVNAGQSVHPSPDGKRFLAERQQNGEDGSEWLVAERSGKSLWDGYAGVLRMQVEKPGTEPVAYVVTSFEQPRWAEDGVLRAKAVCTDAPQAEGVATLVSDQGKWRWQTDLQCRPAASGGR